MDNEKDKYIKERLKKDELISKKADDVFNEFLKNNIYNKGEENMDEKVVKMSAQKKNKMKKILSIAASFMIIFLAANVYAATQGYNNIFFVIKNLFVKDEVVTEKEDILSDRDITISYEYISIADGVKIQINNLKIKEEEAELAISLKERKNNEVKAGKFIVYDITSGAKNKVSEQLRETTDEENYIQEFYNDDAEYQDTEIIKLTNITDETNNLELEILDEAGNSITVLEINLAEKEINIISSKATELQKLSETELKEVLARFAILNYYNHNSNLKNAEDTDEERKNYLKLYIANELIRSKGSNSEEIILTLEKTNKAIKEFTGEKNEDVLELSSDSIYFYNDEKEQYEIIPTDFCINPLCIEIEDLTYENGIYTATFIYCLIPMDLEYNINELTMYKTTMEFKINEDYTYSKYCLVNYEEIESEIIKHSEKDVVNPDTTDKETNDTNTEIDEDKTNGIIDESLKQELKEAAEKYALLNYYKDTVESSNSYYTEEQYRNEMKILVAFHLDTGAPGSVTQFKTISKSIIYDIINAYTGKEFNDNTIYSQIIIGKDDFVDGTFNSFSYIIDEIYSLNAEVKKIEDIEYINGEYKITFTYTYNNLYTNFTYDTFRTTMRLKLANISSMRPASNWVKYQLVDDNFESENISVINDYFILYNGQEISLNTGIQNLSHMDINNDTNNKYNITYYNYEDGKYVGETKGNFGKETYEGESVVQNVKRIAISQQYNAIPRVYDKVEELPEELIDMADCSSVDIHSIDLDNDGKTEYIVCYTVDYARGEIGDGEPVASSGIMLLDSEYKKITDLVNLENGFWANIQEEDRKIFLSLDDIDYIDIDNDGIMEMIIKVPTYEGNMISIVRYNNGKIEGKTNVQANLSA